MSWPWPESVHSRLHADKLSHARIWPVSGHFHVTTSSRVFCWTLQSCYEKSFISTNQPPGWPSRKSTFHPPTHLAFSIPGPHFVFTTRPRLNTASCLLPCCRRRPFVLTTPRQAIILGSSRSVLDVCSVKRTRVVSHVGCAMAPKDTSSSDELSSPALRALGGRFTVARHAFFRGGRSASSLVR